MYIYTVQEGDTLTSIAEQFRSSVDLIRAANPQLAEPLEVGRHLLVPAVGPIRVRVQPGDSLWIFAERYDLPVEVIAAANSLSPPYTIFPGQVLVIPALLPRAQVSLVWLSTRRGRPDLFVRSPGDPRARRITFRLALESSVPRWSPDGRLVAFLGRGNALWTTDVQTLRSDRLIENLQIYTDFDWSPDSTTIAFSRREVVPFIITINVHTGHTNFITEGTWPNYLPDGKRIVFVRTENGQSQLYAINIDGTDKRQITHLTEPGEIHSLVVSPDGTKGAYAFPAVSAAGVYIVDLATGAVTKTPPGPLGHDFNPAWSPDSQHLAYNASTDEGPMGLRGIVRVVNREGAEEHDLTDTACFAGRLVFSPDSRNIAYSNCLAIAPQLTVVSPHTRPIQITARGSNENADWGD
jgi:TolB protein